MNNRQLVVDFDLQREDDELVVRVTINNHSQVDLDDWTLKFDLPKAIRPHEGTRLISHIGSHVTLGSSQQTALPSGEQVELVFSGAVSMIQRLSDLPRGLYVSHGEPLAHLRAELGSHNLETIATGRVIPSSGGSTNPHVAASTEIGSAGAGAAADSVTGLQAIVPRPTSTQVSAGVFSVANLLTYHGCAEARLAIVWLTDMLPLECQASETSAAAMDFAINPDLVEEAYLLRIEPQLISIQAADAAGFFNAAATLLQASDAVNNAVRWPCGVIEDRPRFNFRGLMLDCARHFHSKDTVLRTLDLMAQFKLNRFHWHLTDDEGWRLEIQAFPQLTERGAWRGEGEVLEAQFGTGPGRYGGFYSRDDVQEVVSYAAARQIEVIPEIDIPGHSRAALKSCPELLVEEADASQYCGAQLYTDNVLNPALPATYQFLHTVLDEVCDLFPGEYVHLGADEVPDGVWQQSPACSEFMAEHGYESAHELQGHLLRDLQAYLASKGKKL
ncbi:MAG: family 20 glycosylhydrolase, partial [Gemmatimonadetes bacterium]|nr:family 20 glycosylhydrolase [Gemmatimonadota bacterium]